MKNITLPLVMIASLATLVSCGTEPDLGTIVTPVKNPTVTGMVVTPAATPTGEEIIIPVVLPETATGITPEATTPVSVVPSPEVLTRKETVLYNTPNSEEAGVEFQITLTDGIITAASSITLATDDESKYNQDAFAKAVSAKVVGKKAKDLKVDAIGGASLTTTAFVNFVQSL